MNWGKGIITGMAAFILFILSMCFYMLRMPQDEYDHQYYEKGLYFDRDFNEEMQVTKDHARPVLIITGDICTFNFVQPAKGQVRFIRPSSQAMDRSMILNTGTVNKTDVSVKALASGRWLVIIEWKSDHKSYLYQQNVNIR